MSGTFTFEGKPGAETEEATFPDPNRMEQAPLGPGKDCRKCIHAPVCAIFRAVVSALKQFETNDKGESPVKPYGIASSCDAFMDGPARIEITLGKKGRG